MPSNYLIFCIPLLFLPSVFPKEKCPEARWWETERKMSPEKSH